MAGTAITPPAAAAGSIPPNPSYSPLFLNSFRIAAVAERLESHIRNPAKIDTVEFYNLCLSLARGLDYAAANNQIPNRIQELPILLKHVCKLNNDHLLQSAVMVLMISVKNTCRNGWFRPADCEELLRLANEVGNNFCSVKDMNAEASNSEQTISKVMSRYYPRMKIGQILVCLEAKPGFGTFVLDFFIEKHNKTKEKICLFSVQTDNVESSSCIISPQQVNFLLNGKGVDRRTNVFMDPGPQLPTVVTNMLKYGTNLLQAVGQFKGSFIIVLAFMSVISNPERPALQDCDPPTTGSDSEVIEGPSRISLNCPISFTRIKTPVKGHLCKHLQCFDFDNFVDMNSRRPSWRCPHCNQSVSYLDIRVDQNLVKVLKEVDDNVTDVIISADGTWKAVAESGETKDQPHDKTPQDMEPHNVSIPQDICDLTEENDDMDFEQFANETLEEKPNLSSLQTLPAPSLQTQPILPAPAPAPAMPMNGTGEANQNLPHTDDDFWTGLFLSSYGLTARNAGQQPESTLPVLTDAVSPTLAQIPEVLRSQTNGLPLQLPPEIEKFGNEYGRVPPSSRHAVTRTPVAVQALAAAQGSTQSPRSGFNTSLPPPSQTTERQHQHLRSHINNPPPPPVSSMTSPSLPLPLPPHSTAQAISERQHQLFRSQFKNPPPPLSSKTSPSPPPLPPHPTAQASSASNPEISKYLRQKQQAQNFGGSQARSHIPSNQSQLAAANAASLRATQMTRQQQPPSWTVPIQTTRQPVGNQSVNLSGTSQAAAARTDGGSPNLPPEQNWRPTGRMRGALTGQAYSEAVNKYINQQNQSAARPTPNVASPPQGLPPHLQALLANNRNTHIAPPAANLQQSQPASTNGSSGVVPEASSGMRPG